MTAAHPAPVAAADARVTYLTLEEVLDIVVAFGGVDAAVEVRDIGLLIGAVDRPGLVFEGREVYPTMAEKAASLLESIAGQTPLTRGNKRLGWLAIGVFLELNSVELRFEDAEAVALLREVARRVISTEELTARLAERMGTWPPPSPPRERRRAARSSAGVPATAPTARAAASPAGAPAAAETHPRRPGQPRHP